MLKVIQNDVGAVCIKLSSGDYELSIAVDDGFCQEVGTIMLKSDIKVFKDGKEITTEFVPIDTDGDFDTILEIMQAIKARG